jgi:hypothetical protein
VGTAIENATTREDIRPDEEEVVSDRRS